MHRQVRQIQAEWPILVPLDEVHSMLCNQVGGVAFFGNHFEVLPPVLDEGPIDARMVIHVAATISAELVEALLGRVELDVVA